MQGPGRVVTLGSEGNAGKRVMRFVAVAVAWSYERDTDNLL